MASPNDRFRTFTIGDTLPDDAVDLFGDDVREAFRRVAAPPPPPPEAPPSPPGVPEVSTPLGKSTPVIIAAVGDAGGWLAGVYLWIESPGAGADGERVASIRQLVVKPAHRGRGLGGWLLRRAHAAAEEMGCARIRSTAGWGCPDHLSMYDRLGYEQVDDQRPYLVTKTL